jgi:hypothetical protein
MRGYNQGTAEREAIAVNQFVRSEAFWGIIGGGLVAAVITIIFSAYWDTRKQRLTEDWEFKRFHANLIHFATTGLMEAYFSVKAELFYLTSGLELLLATLGQLATQAEAIVRQQAGPGLTVQELDQRKAQLLQPFEKYNNEQIRLRWEQYGVKAKENQAKAEMHLRGLQPLISESLYRELGTLFERLSAPFVWDLPHGKEKLKIYEDSLPEVAAVRAKLMRELERKLGRRTNP